MKTKKSKQQTSCQDNIVSITTNYQGNKFMGSKKIISSLILIFFICSQLVLVSCEDEESINNSNNNNTNNDEYTIERTLADGGQRNTIAFDGLAFLTGNLGGQSFLPPGKVADFCGFQYFRDNDKTNMGHNTDFVTIIAFNILHILTQEQIDQMISSAQVQVAMINEYAYQRFPLMKAFRRLFDGDLAGLHGS